MTSSATAREPPDPQWPGGARLALSFVLNYEEGGETTPLEGDAASEAFLHEVVGAPRDGRAAEPQRGVDVRVRQPRRLLARPAHLRAARAAADRLRRRAGARAQPGGGARDGRRGLGGREPRLALDRLRATCPRTRSASTCAARSRRSSACAAPRPVGWYTGRTVGEHAPPRGRGGRLPLRLGLLRGRAAVLGRGRRPAAPRDPVHARRERLQVPDPERLRDRGRLLRVPRRHVRAALRGGRPA